MKTCAASYYDFSPALKNATGDIWSSLPTYGILSVASTAAIVVTPSCDLAQGKVNAITYLPIIPLRSYFSLPAAIPEVTRAIEGQLTMANIGEIVSFDDNFALPSMTTIATAENLLAEHERLPRLGQKDLIAVKRACAGMRILKEIIRPSITEVATSDLNLLFGDKEWAKIKNNMVRNSFRTDVHFLPADGQRSEWTGLPKHSLVLFRYPITVPIEILEAAQDVSLSDWTHWCEQMSEHFPAAGEFAKVRPMKRLNLKVDFISDLLTRFVALYVRLGSPDFSPETISQYSFEIDL